MSSTSPRPHKRVQRQPERPMCSVCGIRPTARRGKLSKNGFMLFDTRCTTCNGQIYRVRPYAKHKKGFCEVCGFVPVHSCQLDVDHIDGDKQNNSAENLRTLCANCHRLKTHQRGEFRGQRMSVALTNSCMT